MYFSNCLHFFQLQENEEQLQQLMSVQLLLEEEEDDDALKKYSVRFEHFALLSLDLVVMNISSMFMS